MRLRTVLLLFLTAIAFNSCGVARRQAGIRPTPVTHRGTGWVATEQESGTFLIIYLDSVAEKEAMDQLCSKEYICFSSPAGEAMTVSRRLKNDSRKSN